LPQPDVLVGLVRRARDYDREPGARKYFGRRFGMDMGGAGTGSTDFSYAAGGETHAAGLPLLPEGLTAFAAAQAYYHRPGDWREVPNFFNPLWGARLMPIAESNAANLVRGWSTILSSEPSCSTDHAAPGRTGRLGLGRSGHPVPLPLARPLLVDRAHGRAGPEDQGVRGRAIALWETTVWKPAPEIEREVERRFQDLRSPAGIQRASTGLLLYPRSSSLRWKAEVDTAAGEVTLAGNRPAFGRGPGILGSFVATVAGWMAGGVQAAMRQERLNTSGVASARARLVHAGRDGSKCSPAGTCRPAGRKRPWRSRLDRGPDLHLAPSATASAAARLRHLEGLAKPATFQLSRAPTDLTVSPQQGHPEVEKQVAAQVGEIAFFGMRQKPWFTALDSSWAASRAAG